MCLCRCISACNIKAFTTFCSCKIWRLAELCITLGPAYFLSFWCISLDFTLYRYGEQTRVDVWKPKSPMKRKVRSIYSVKTDEEETPYRLRSVFVSFFPLFFCFSSDTTEKSVHFVSFFIFPFFPEYLCTQLHLLCSHTNSPLHQVSLSIFLTA